MGIDVNLSSIEFTQFAHQALQMGKLTPSLIYYPGNFLRYCLATPYSWFKPLLKLRPLLQLGTLLPSSDSWTNYSSIGW